MASKAKKFKSESEETIEIKTEVQIKDEFSDEIQSEQELEMPKLCEMPKLREMPKLKELGEIDPDLLAIKAKAYQEISETSSGSVPLSENQAKPYSKQKVRKN